MKHLLRFLFGAAFALSMCLMASCTAKGGASMQITSPAFEHNQLIPNLYTCDGSNINPPLKISGIPQGAKTLALIVDDPDAPAGTWVHWVVYNIPPTETIEENSVPGEQGYNNFNTVEYGGPCPPMGTHRYFFKVYALDTELSLNKNMTKKGLEAAMAGHILAKGELIGRYQRTY